VIDLPRVSPKEDTSSLDQDTHPTVTIASEVFFIMSNRLMAPCPSFYTHA
jgi:hypothetical protein